MQRHTPLHIYIARYLAAGDLDSNLYIEINEHAFCMYWQKGKWTARPKEQRGLLAGGTTETDSKLAVGLVGNCGAHDRQ